MEDNKCLVCPVVSPGLHAGAPCSLYQTPYNGNVYCSNYYSYTRRHPIGLSLIFFLLLIERLSRSAVLCECAPLPAVWWNLKMPLLRRDEVEDFGGKDTLPVCEVIVCVVCEDSVCHIPDMLQIAPKERFQATLTLQQHSWHYTEPPPSLWLKAWAGAHRK